MTGGGDPHTPPVTASRQVSWFEVYLFVEQALGDLGVDGSTPPLAGTPAWSDLPDDDPGKVAAVLLGGVRDALRNDTHQQVIAEASRNISAGTDWRGVARDMLQRNGIYIPRKGADVA